MKPTYSLGIPMGTMKKSVGDSSVLSVDTAAYVAGMLPETDQNRNLNHWVL